MLNLLLNDTLNIYAGLTIRFTEEFNVAEMELEIVVRRLNKKEPMTPEELKRLTKAMSRMVRVQGV